MFYISPRSLRKVHNEVIDNKEQDLPAGLLVSPKRTLHRDKLAGLRGWLTQSREEGDQVAEKVSQVLRDKISRRETEV